MRFNTGTTIFADNQGCIALTKNQFSIQKRITSTSSFTSLREKVDEHVIEIVYKPIEKWLLTDLQRQ